MQPIPCAITFPPVPSIDTTPLRVNLQSPLPAITASGIRIGASGSGFYFLWPVVEIHGPDDGLRIEGASNITVTGVSLIGFW